MTREVLNHLCEAYLYGGLYQTDFISLMKIKKSKQEEFTNKMWNWYENWCKEQRRLEEENPLHWKDYVEGGEEFADYLLKVKAGEI